METRRVVELINSVQFDWDKIVETLIDFLKNGEKYAEFDTHRCKKHYQRFLHLS